VLQAVIAALRLLAKIALVLPVAKVPTVELVQPFEPRVPAVGTHAKIPVPFVTLGVKVVKLPGIVSVTVTVFELVVVEKPTAAAQNPIAVLK
jgi:hypothetical protein